MSEPDVWAPDEGDFRGQVHIRAECTLDPEDARAFAQRILRAADFAEEVG